MGHQATIRLSRGAVMPRIGFGTSPMGDDAIAAVLPGAIAAGYRLIDTAENYANEVAVGRAIAESGVARAELFVTTKFNKAFHGRDLVRVAAESSLERLGLDYLDLFMIHWPNPGLGRYVEAYEGLLDLYEAGLVAAVGCSNFKAGHLQALLDATGVGPDVNQIECNPLVSRAALRDFDEAHGIVTESWSPLGGTGAAVLDEPVVAGIAERLGESPAAVVLAWHLALGLVAIPKTARLARALENLHALDLELSPADVGALSGLDRGEQAALDSDRFGH